VAAKRVKRSNPDAVVALRMKATEWEGQMRWSFVGGVELGGARYVVAAISENSGRIVTSVPTHDANGKPIPEDDQVTTCYLRFYKLKRSGTPYKTQARGKNGYKGSRDRNW